MAQNFKQLIVWQKAMELVTDIYEVTKSFPKDEIYGLTAQLRRAAISIPSNIAEGQARYSKRDFRHFLRQAKGSVAEVQTQILIARNLKYLTEEAATKFEDRLVELLRMLNALINSLGEQSADGAASGH